MAASDASPWPVRGQAFRVTFDLRLSTGALNVGAAGLDSEVSKDGGTFTDCTNEATEIATSSGIYTLDLTAAEMAADTVAIQIKSSTGSAVTQVLVLYPVSIAEPGSSPTFPTDIEKALGWITAQASNLFTQTATTSTLRNRADNADISTSTVSDDGTTFTRGAWT